MTDPRINPAKVPLRTLSARPELVVDQRNGSVIDPAGARIGFQGPFGRERVVSALPLTETPNQWLQPSTVVHDSNLAYPADTDLNLLADNNDAVWVSRLLTARWTEDTRRLAG
jgi:hypothetical protein